MNCNRNIIKAEELNEKADKVKKADDVADVIKQYEEIIRTRKRHHINSVLSRKSFLKKKEKFMKLVSKFKVHKNTMIFKKNIFKLIDKHPS